MRYKPDWEVIAIAEAIGRTPSAVAMKACNFASLDPNTKQKGLGNVSQADRELWAAFMRDSEQVSLAAEDAYLSRVKPVGEEADQLSNLPLRFYPDKEALRYHSENIFRT